MLKEDLVLEYASDLFCEECKSLLAKDPYLNVSLTLRDFTLFPTSFPPSLGMFARSKRDISILYVILLSFAEHLVPLGGGVLLGLYK